MVEESNQNVFLIQIDASSLTEFEISEFEISRAYCTFIVYSNTPMSIHKINSGDMLSRNETNAIEE